MNRSFERFSDAPSASEHDHRRATHPPVFLRYAGYFLQKPRNRPATPDPIVWDRTDAVSPQPPLTPFRREAKLG